MYNTLVVNFFGGPCTRKSTYAAEVFALLKHKGIDCELVQEFAKQLTWHDRHNTLVHQEYLFGKQSNYLFHLNGKVQVIITDSPIILGCVYYPNKTRPTYEHFKNLALTTFYEYNNFNILLRRSKEYNPNGRNQTKAEAIELDEKIRDFLDLNEVGYYYLSTENIGPILVKMIIDAL